MIENAPFTEEQIALAGENYESQERLFDSLRSAFSMSEISIEDLADELEISLEDAQGWIDGEFDLTLSQLRHLANAIDAHVRYQVEPLNTLYADRFEHMVRAQVPGEWLQTESIWSTHPTPFASV